MSGSVGAIGRGLFFLKSGFDVSESTISLLKLGACHERGTGCTRAQSAWIGQIDYLDDQEHALGSYNSYLL